MIYYYFICHRKLWYFLNEINMEQNSELVTMGKILDESTHSRDKKGIMIDNTINIDFIKNVVYCMKLRKQKVLKKQEFGNLSIICIIWEKEG